MARGRNRSGRPRTRWSAALLTCLMAAATFVWLLPTVRVWVPTGRTATPPMGWNDWNVDGCSVDEHEIATAIHRLVDTGLRDLGYRTVTVDDCWAASSRGPDGRLVADPVRFPHGIAALADLAHRDGLQLGIYSSAGSMTCANAQPGSLGHELLDASTFVAWGVDQLKYDNCGDVAQYPDSQAGYSARFGAMATAIAQVGRATGRTLVYSLCEWGVYLPWQWADAQANSWRTTLGVLDDWSSMVDAFRSTVLLGSHARPGAWNDPDMLQVGNGGMTDTEYRTQFSLWAMMAAPLVIGTDLQAADPATLAVLGNRAVVAVDQDPLGSAAEVARQDGDHWVLTRPLADGDTAIALVNTGAEAATITAADPAGPDGSLTDLWTGRRSSAPPVISVTVPAHGTVVYRVHPGAGSG